MIYVDQIREHDNVKGYARRHGKQWCHLIADTEEELHAFAQRLGLKRVWAQYNRHGCHYDMIPSKRALAIKYGAQEITWRELAIMQKIKIDDLAL